MFLLVTSERVPEKFFLEGRWEIGDSSNRDFSVAPISFRSEFSVHCHQIVYIIQIYFSSVVGRSWPSVWRTEPTISSVWPSVKSVFVRSKHSRKSSVTRSWPRKRNASKQVSNSSRIVQNTSISYLIVLTFYHLSTFQRKPRPSQSCPTRPRSRNLREFIVSPLFFKTRIEERIQTNCNLIFKPSNGGRNQQTEL